MRPRREAGAGSRSSRAWQWLLLTTGLFFLVWYCTWPSPATQMTHDSRAEDSPLLHHAEEDAPSLLHRPLAPAGRPLAGEIPVVSITFGECRGDYLSFALKELTKRNGNVVVLGDSESCALLARQTGTKFISRKPYSTEGDAFRERWADVVDASKRKCLSRWMIMRDWMRANSIHRAFHRDIDTLVYVNVTEAGSKYTEEVSLVSIPPRVSGHFAFWTLPALEDFCAFMEEILINKVWVAGDGKYVTNDMQAMRLYSFAHLAPEKRPCWGFQAVEGTKECAEVWERLCNPKVLDKARERNRRPKYTPGSLALPRHGMMWDNNFDMDDEWGLFAAVPGSTYKQIEWRDGDQPFFIFNEQANVGQSFGWAEGLPEPAVQAAGLHFQGGKKSVLSSYTTWDTEWTRRCRCSTPACRNCVIMPAD